MNAALVALLFCQLLSGCGGLPAYDEVDPQALATLWDSEHVSGRLPVPPLIRHADVVDRLNVVQASAPDIFSVEEVGQSSEGRSINHLWFGHGSFRVLMWSQMHGDEPTATAALFDLFEYVRTHQADPVVSRILDRLTIHTVPMLNPDGAERYQRRNAQSIDINRDALLLQTPEGRTLKALRDRLNPPIGFNLHNQNWRTSVGRPPQPATLSLLAVAYDEARSDNPGRVLAKRLCAVIRDAVEPFASGQLGRYDDSFEVRAFGDNLTLWGTSVVLIETGPWAMSDPDPVLVRLNFIALVSALDALATGRVLMADPRRYEALPLNESRLFHTMVKGATIVSGTGVEPFLGDIGIVASRVVRGDGEARRVTFTGQIEDIGDLRVYGALDTIDATGMTVIPLRPGLQVGDVVRAAQLQQLGQGPTITVGQPGRLALLASIEGGNYRVARIVDMSAGEG